MNWGKSCWGKNDKLWTFSACWGGGLSPLQPKPSSSDSTAPTLSPCLPPITIPGPLPKHKCNRWLQNLRCNVEKGKTYRTKLYTLPTSSTRTLQITEVTRTPHTHPLHEYWPFDRLIFTRDTLVGRFQTGSETLSMGNIVYYIILDYSIAWYSITYLKYSLVWHAIVYYSISYHSIGAGVLWNLERTWGAHGIRGHGAERQGKEHLAGPECSFAYTVVFICFYLLD